MGVVLHTHPMISEKLLVANAPANDHP